MATIKEIVKIRPHLPINQNRTIDDAVKFLCRHNISATLVSNDAGEIVGIFSEKDVVRKVLYRELDPKTTKVAEVMSSKIIHVHEDEDVNVAKILMIMNGVRHLVLVDDNHHVCGLISIRDLIESDLTESKELLKKVNDAYYEHEYLPTWRISSNRVIIEPHEPNVDEKTSSIIKFL
ncbi:MAG: CBS domain-containing protein [Candidatus Hydrogenedentes bacterium]|nr:CBS domain-containing protein [Candidatus Hydrogenedentota bacterium]